MKTLKSFVLGVCITGLIVFLSSVSFAEDGHHKLDLNLVKNAAVALQSSNADLASGLMKYVDEETKEDSEKKDEKGEKEGSAEEKDENGKQAKRDANIKLFRDSAAALQANHPDLAEILTKSADWKEKKLKEIKENSKEVEANEMKDKK